MKRLFGAMIAAAALLMMTGRAEAAPIYVGYLDYCANCAYINVTNDSDGLLDDIILTMDTGGTPKQYAFGRLDADPDDLNFFLVGTADFASVSRGPAEGATFYFDSFGILSSDFLSASLSFTFDGLMGDQPVIVTSGEAYADLYVTPVPEPGTLLLLGSGIAAMAARRRRTRSAGR